MKLVTLSYSVPEKSSLICETPRAMAVLPKNQWSLVMLFAKAVSNSLCLAVSALLLLSVPNIVQVADAATFNYEQTFSNKSATGEELAHAFFDLLSNTGSPAGTVGATPEQNAASKALVKPYLDPAFQLQRATGERYTAENYLPADVDDFKVGDVRETRPDDDLVVVRYSVRVVQDLPDAALVMSKDKAPRLTAFHWSHTDSRWKILSHANFNTPVAAICDQKPIVHNRAVSRSSPDDQALGEHLLAQFYDLLMKGDAITMLSPEIQVQSASGLGYTTLAERKSPSRYDDLHFNDALVTRNGDVLVISSYNRAGQRSFMKVDQLRSGIAPFMVTFMLDDKGAWSIVSIASFAAPKALPDGIACVPSGKLENAP
jgi:hypothetical protein